MEIGLEGEPFLPSRLEPILEAEEEPIPESAISDHDIQDPCAPGPSAAHFSQPRNTIHRCKTAPALAAMRDSKSGPGRLSKPSSDSSSIIRQAFFLLFLYLTLGVVIYSFNRDNFSGFETHAVVDALYFCIVTMCTIGYGDIAPLTPATKENMILTSIQMGGAAAAGRGFSARNYIVDVEKGRMRIRLKVGLALGVVVLCIGTGTMMLYFLENLDWIDSVYLSVMSVTTVGYGDKAFKTLPGRLFAAIWLLFSTLAVARAFLYLAEARIDKRHRRITKWVLHREITVEDLLAADVNHHGFISKSEYVIYKLKEMGKIGENDILQICNQFNKLDPNNSGKITLPNLLENYRL